MVHFEFTERIKEGTWYISNCFFCLSSWMNQGNTVSLIIPFSIPCLIMLSHGIGYGGNGMSRKLVPMVFCCQRARFASFHFNAYINSSKKSEYYPLLGCFKTWIVRVRN